MDIKCISIKFHENRTSSFSVLFILVPLILSFRNAQLLEEMIADTKFYGQTFSKFIVRYFVLYCPFNIHASRNKELQS